MIAFYKIEVNYDYLFQNSFYGLLLKYKNYFFCYHYVNL